MEQVERLSEVGWSFFHNIRFPWCLTPTRCWHSHTHRTNAEVGLRSKDLEVILEHVGDLRHWSQVVGKELDGIS